MRKNLVSAIVVTSNRKQDLIKCIGSLSHSEYNQYISSQLAAGLDGQLR